MEFDVPFEAGQDLDSGSGQVEPDCLRVSVILRKIFQHFSTRELLQLSLVNKFWSYEARCLLRDRGSVALTINVKTGTCQDLRALASALRLSKAITGVLPFSGLFIDLFGLNWTHTDSCTESSSTDLNEVFDDILGQITWKSLSVEFYRWTEEFINCPGFVLVKKLLQKFGSILEVLWVAFPSEEGDILHQVLQSCSFPRLLTLRIEHSDEEDNGYTNWIKTIVSRAPKLKLFETFNYVDLNANLLEGSSAVHVTGYDYSPFLNQIPESLVGTFQMTRMDLTEISQDFQLDRFSRITAGLLEVSRPTLNWMTIDVIFLVPLAAYGICLENVNRLEINLNQPELDDLQPELDDPEFEEYDLQPDLLRIAKSFDFTRIFPNLEDVTLDFYSEFDYFVDGIQEMVERGNAAFREPMPDRAVNIKKLSVEYSRKINDSGARLLAEMFPDLETLSIQGTEIPFGRIWESWPNLKALEVNDVPTRSVLKNLDSVFCGMFPEEVTLLRNQDEEYLRSVNIVPVMPSITGLKRLKTLKFIFGVLPMEQVNDGTALFSKATGLIAFKRCPGLEVTLITKEGREPRYLQHSKSVRLEY